MLFWQQYSNMTSQLFEDMPALFGGQLPKDGLMVRANDRRTECMVKNTSTVSYGTS